MAVAAEQAAMRHAIALASSVPFTAGPNPRVGAVVLDASGKVLGEGAHRGVGTPHAEVAALSAAGECTGATLVVTLEPCDHHGRTPPCTKALIAAGVRRVVFAQDDTNPTAAGGAETLRGAGVDVEGGLLAGEAEALNPIWTFAMKHRRPFVTYKVAASMDGRVAAADGTSKWISGAESRRQVQELRALVDAVLVGTGTVVADDPHLTARNEDGEPRATQPLRVIMGERPVPSGARVLDEAADTLHLTTRDPGAALEVLFDRDVQHLLLEGGPTIAGAFFRAQLVDRVVGYLSPILLGDGSPMVGSLGIDTLADAIRLSVDEVSRVGDDIRLVGTVIRGDDS
jgi:diaminohydroxyphosphoribosylaminopyrimidine deaminase/5-amino-6-(5-phosphoribosylamino)uracil reductase